MADRVRTPPRTVVELLGVATAYLDARGFETPRLDVELLLGHVLGMQRLELYLHHDRPLEQAEVDAFRELLRRRAAGEPVAYLLGSAGFRRLLLKVDARVLVPRPETEVLVELVLARLPAGGSLLDVGTGSGAIALAVASERADARVTAVDVSDEALALARENRDALGLADRVELVRSDLYDGLADGARFDVVAANPPYIGDDDPRLDPHVRDHEPHVAIFAGADGLDVIRRLVAGARARLVPGGVLAIEVAEGQASPVRALLAAAGFANLVVERDLAAIERCVAGTAP
jgi:release factor glutamine methyltransferase